MKSILLKLDDELLHSIDEQVKILKTNRSSYIKKALQAYNDWLKKKEMEDKLRRDVHILKENDPDTYLKKEFQDASLTDLQKYLD